MAGWIALGLLIAYVLLAFGWRAWVQQRRTGDHGFRGFHGARGSTEWWAGLLVAVGMLLVVAGPVAAIAGMPTVPGLDDPWVTWTGGVVALVGIVVTVLVQMAMGSSWRVGVDEAERTDLVTRGPFAVVRNPIFTAMIVSLTGLALLVANPVALVALVVVGLGIELQVRAVEEPYLRRAHGQVYVDYSRRVGRFLPGVGRGLAGVTS